MSPRLAGILTLLVLVCAVCSTETVCETITSGEATDWIRHTVPLPKSIKLTGKVEVPADRVMVVYQGDSDIVTDQTVKELIELFTMPMQAGYAPAFIVTLAMGGEEAEPLKELKNSDQAYRILAPDDKNLRLVALAPRGIYYAAKTLQQLVNAKKSGANLTIPILEVTDWPDMPKRGLWGSDNFNHLKWLADRKMNLMEQISHLKAEDGKLIARPKDGREPLVTEGPLYGIEFSPVILHLEQSSGSIMQIYPHVKGKGSTHGGVLCYSQPEVADALAEWMVQLASLPHVTSIDTWMTENLAGAVGCQCDRCKVSGKPWPVLEARSIIAGWNKAQERLGREFTLRVMTAESTEFCNYEVFRELPPEVELAYYHSLLTYNTFRRPMLRKYIAEEAARGRWVGVVPNVCPSVGFAQPFTGAHFIHYRMSEFVSKGLSGLLGYATPRVHYCRFNVEAAAEWTWNLRGRTPREFAYSYAVRQGCKDPEKFAEWSETMGPVAWDVIGSGFPNEELRGATGPVAGRLEKGTLPPLGFILWDAYPSPWGNIPNEEQLDNDLKASARGVKLARELGIPSVLYESLIIDGYIRAIKALYELKPLVRPDGVLAMRRDDAHDWYLRYVAGLRQARAALPKWEETVRMPSDPHFTGKPVGIIDGMLRDMKGVAERMGF